MNRLERKYKKVVASSPMKKFNYKSAMKVSYVDKIVINMSIGEVISNSKALDEAVAELTQIIGQAPVITKVEESIANPKLHEGMSIGCKITPRKEKMYDFMDKLMNISLPRVRDLRGVSVTPSDGRGNYTPGVKEQLILLEVDYDEINKVRGMDIVTVTTVNMNEEAKALLEEMGISFKK